MSKHWRDAEFMSVTEAVGHAGTRRTPHLILWMIVCFVAAAILWANWATLDEVTRGEGRIISSSSLQVVQNLEGGIISHIEVSEGDVVNKGQVLLRIDDTRFSSSYEESRLRYLAAQVKIARLQAEVESRPFNKPDGWKEVNAALFAREKALFISRRSEVDSNLAILREQESQRQQELIEQQARLKQIASGLKLAEKELAIYSPLVKQGVMSEVELIRQEREVNDLNGELNSTRLAIPRTRAALRESQRKLDDVRVSFRNTARNELNDQQKELGSINESIRAQRDRVVRTTVRSPVHGTIQRLLVSTIGGVVQPGMDLVEIVPLEDTLVVESRIRPSDIAFLHPGQKATVKLSAYDFAIYGGLKAELEHISADTIKDERGESFYLIRLRTQENQLATNGNALPIIPGMTATVDILTGKKTVMHYLLKPVNRMADRALTER